MQERLKGITDRLKEFWEKLSKRQKAMLISLVAAVVVAIAIVGAVSSQPSLVNLITCETTRQASEVKSILDEDGSIPYEMSQDGLTFSVEEEYEGDASILLGANSIPTEGYSIENVFDGGLSTTEADKTKKYQLYLEEKMADQLEAADNIETASVTLSIPTDDGTLIAQNQDTYASVILGLSGEMTEEQAQGLARYVATAVGNDTTDSVLLMDSSSNVLFSGGDTSTSIGTASSQLSYQAKAEDMVKSEVSGVVLGTNIYDNVNVGLNLVLDFDRTDYTNHHYYVDEGQTQGYLDSDRTYSSETTQGNGDVPGTDTNGADTTYVMEDNDTSSSTITETENDYLPSEEITETTGSTGSIDYENSSVSVVATTYRIYNEDQLEADGTLEEMSFDDFVAANSERVRTEVDPDFYGVVANATGFSEDNISIVAYEVPFFQYSEGSSRSLTDYMQIILAVLIFALLGFVVFRSTRKTEVEDIQPELSVETLLESTKEVEEGLEDIGYNEKSETRVMIEKFVDENPDAVAALLRNWLNEEWE